MGFSGSKAKIDKFDTLTHKQKARLNKYMSAIHFGDFNLSNDRGFRESGSFLRDMMDPNSEANQRMAKPYMTQFEEEEIPQLAEQFTQYDQQDSSGFKLALGKSASGLQERLAGLRTQNAMNAAQGAMEYGQLQPGIYQNMMTSAMGTSPFSYLMTPGKSGWGNTLLSSLSRAAPMALAAMFA